MKVTSSKKSERVKTAIIPASRRSFESIQIEKDTNRVPIARKKRTAGAVSVSLSNKHIAGLSSSVVNKRPLKRARALDSPHARNDDSTDDNKQHSEAIEKNIISNPSVIEEYASHFEANVRDRIVMIRDFIVKEVIGADDKHNLYETISYSLGTLVYDGQYLVHLGGFKNHVGFYPMTDAIAAVENDLKGNMILIFKQ